jgi:ATP-independent RNA helicase DbpA
MMRLCVSLIKHQNRNKVESLHDDNDIKQIFYEVETDNKTQALIALLNHYKPESSIIFCNTKKQCQQLLSNLSTQGFHACALHGDLEQRERDQIIVQFSNKSSSILIATDVAARGLDIKELAAVINFDLSPDPEVHIHRIGRTGRAGNQGLALSLFLPTEKFRIEKIEAIKNSPVLIEKIAGLIERNKEGNNEKLIPPMVTLGINGGRKDKVRAGDILGALTANKEIPGKQIGKIDIFDKYAYVAVEQKIAKKALVSLSEGKIKGRKFKIKRLH